MKKLGIYIAFLLFITIIIPSILVQVNVTQNSDQSENRKEKTEKIKDIEFKNDQLIKIYNTKTKKTENIAFEEYVLGVLASEMPAAFHEEALKAQAVAARTYAISRIEKHKNGHPDHKDASLCTDTHCQAWMSKDELLAIHGEKWFTDYWDKLSMAVKETEGEVLTYQDSLVTEALFHSTSGGKTEDSETVFATAYPYLKSVDSPFEESSPKYQNSVEMSLDEFINKLKSKYPKANITKANVKDKVKIAESSDTGRIKSVLIDGEKLSGTSFRQMFELNSTNFNITLRDDDIEIETLGYGHGVGMSQWGANGMGKEGKSYKEILEHYYTGTQVKDDFIK